MKYGFNKMSDSEIISLIKSEKEESESAMEYFLDKYKVLVLQRARTMYLVGGEKDDLIQEGMIGLYKAVREYDVKKENSFRSFAATVVYQQMCNAINASNRKKNGPLNEYVSIYAEYTAPYGDNNKQPYLLEVMEADSSSNPEDLVIDKENTDMLEFEIEKCLSQLEKKVYRMYVEGIDYKTIAASLDKTPKAVDNALQRIRAKVSKVIEKLEY